DPPAPVLGRSQSSLPPPPPPPTEVTAALTGRGITRLARIIVIAGGVAVSFWIDRTIFTALIVLFVLIVPFEKVYPRQKGQRIRRPLVTNDIGFALLGPLLNAVGIVALVLIGGFSLF
ncbi:MAG: hypothetical protein ACR2PK_00930, partial [Acidimicrobiales bacterium]